MRQTIPKTRMPRLWFLCSLVAGSPALAQVTATSQEQNEEASPAPVEEVDQGQSDRQSPIPAAETNPTKDEKTSLAKEKAANPGPVEHKGKTPLVPFARNHSFSLEGSFVVANLTNIDELGSGLDFGLHKNFGGFSFGGAFQYRHLPWGEHEGDTLDLFGLALEPRGLFQLGDRITLYLGFQLNGLGIFQQYMGTLLGGATGGILLQLGSWGGFHAGVELLFINFIEPEVGLGLCNARLGFTSIL